MIKHVNSEEFNLEVIKKKDKLVIVDFFATWCTPCQNLSPVLEKIAEERDDFDIVKVDIDENDELAVEYAIEFVPTLLAFRNGEMVAEIEAVPDEKLLLEQIEEILK